MSLNAITFKLKLHSSCVTLSAKGYDTKAPETDSPLSSCHLSICYFEIMKKFSVLWFRNGLRLHDNPSLHEAVAGSDSQLLPVFIFDGETAGTKWKCYNRTVYLLECLEELNQRFKAAGSRLHIFK